jgi:hypothetical protein
VRERLEILRLESKPRDIFERKTLQLVGAQFLILQFLLNCLEYNNATKTTKNNNKKTQKERALKIYILYT